MHLFAARPWRFAALGTFLVCAALTSCNSSGAGNAERPTPVIGTFAAGQRVRVGDLEYVVTQVTRADSLEGAAPKHQFLLLHVEIGNDGQQRRAVPGMVLTSGTEEIREVTEGVGSVPGYLGLIRSVEPGQTIKGTVVFDAPAGSHKLIVSDGSDPEHEKVAHIEIPSGAAAKLAEDAAAPVPSTNP